MEGLLERLCGLLWSWPLLGLILGTGLYLTLRLRCLPLRQLGRGVRLSLRSGGADGLSPFAGLCTMLSAAVGTGNLVGVASALALGGPGALFWMEISALTGLAVKYAEGFLAVKYRFRKPDGTRWGGPFAYILLGLGPGARPLAGAFALFGALAGICGVGTMVQMGSVTEACRYVLTKAGRLFPTVTILGHSAAAPAAILGLVLAAAATAILSGGIRRISGAAQILVPVMGGLYSLCCLWIILRHAAALPGVLKSVVQGALSGRGAGWGCFAALQAGVSRGVFSNEAGLGTAPIAAAASGVRDPMDQGLISMTTTVFDTFLICTLTGLAILSSGVDVGKAGLGAAMEAFARGLPLRETVGRCLVFLCLTLFAFTTVVSWNYYGLTCLRFLTRRRGLSALYQILYIGTVFLAPYLSIGSLWQAANLCNGLMAVPNLIGILLLSPSLDGHDTMEKRSCGRTAHGNLISGPANPHLCQAPGCGIHG